MDSSKIISLEDYTRHKNEYPGEEEALQFALNVCELLNDKNGDYPLLSPRNIYIENDTRWVTANPPLTKDPSEALFRAGAVLHHLLARSPFRISYYLDGPPPLRDRNPQISVRFESVVIRLLQNVKSLRYISIVELQSDLQRLQKEMTGDWTVRWPCFKANGLRTSFVADESWDPSGQTLKELWRAQIGEVWASPAMAGESLFVGSGDGNFYSIDSSTGKVIWKLFLGGRIESSACIQGNKAYVGSDLGMLYAINIRNGSLAWKKSLSEYVRSSPFCDGKHVYAGSINPEKKSGMLWALYPDSGGVAWKKPLGAVFASPVVDQGEIFIGSDDEHFYCVTTDGAVKWQVSLSGKIRSTAAMSRDFLYAGGFAGTLYKLRRSTGEIVWRNSEAGSMYSSPALGKGILAVGNNAGAVQVFQLNAGKQKGSFASGGPVTASPLIVNQNVLCGSNDGRFYVLDAQANSVCSFDAKSPINSSPILRDGTIYFGSDHGLHALSF